MNDDFTVLENTFIPLSDGRRLAARIWLPDGAGDRPVPAVLEYLPYRKRDGTRERDESTYPVFARAGYAGVRVDISGNGDSDGDFDDEYSRRELDDGVQVIQWIAAQPWCDGAVGMMGISWGGFNSLQIAALNPPALKAVIAIGTTVDRYNDDIHYKNGCLLYSNFAWSSVMLAFASRAPDPEIVGESWRDTWLQRLATQPFPLETWLRHPWRDDYWKHGSICEDYATVRAPCLVISGWADGYINAPPAVVENLEAPARAINGPWLHKYPHFAWPHPRMDFHGEALRWWDRWLRGVDNDAESLPDYRAYILENVRPTERREADPGRWVAEPEWPSPNVSPEPWRLGEGRLDPRIGRPRVDMQICSPQDCGTESGEFFPLKPDREMAGDQAPDDAGALVFDSGILERDVEILGRPEVRLRAAIDRPVGNLVFRLVDLHADGVGYRVSWGVINLCHRNGNEHPQAVTPGRKYTLSVALDECGYRFLKGHRMRLSISTAYWPMVLPPPEVVTATIETGDDSALILPVRTGGEDYDMPLPGAESALPEYPRLSTAEYRREVARAAADGLTRMNIIDDSGESEIPGHGLRVRQRQENQWRIHPDDPATACMQSVFTCWMARGEWAVRTVSESSLACDKTHFHIQARVRAFEGEREVSCREWKQSLKRELV